MRTNDNLTLNEHNEEANDVQIIYKLNNRSPENTSEYSNLPRPSKYLTESIFQQEEINSWDKIYDLPPHSSTITYNHNIQLNGNVRNRTRLFERVSEGAEREESQNLNSTQQRSLLEQRVFERIICPTQSPPAPKNYIKANRYIPPALPPGYNVFNFC